MNKELSESQKSSGALHRMGGQLLVFLIVLNLGILIGLVRLYQKSDTLKQRLEAREVALLKDSITQRMVLDSLRNIQIKPASDTTTLKPEVK